MAKAEPEMRDYAQQENDYILSLLLRPEKALTHEKPIELAQRNCTATAKCFGKSDQLHAMALNTLAFVHLHNDEDLQVAKDSAAKAVEILQDRDGEEEMLLEARCLMAMAKAKAGSTNWSAFAEVLKAPITGRVPVAPMQAASQSLSELLARSVYEKPLKRIVLLIALRDIATGVLGELKAGGETAAHKLLGNQLAAFLEIYYGPAKKGGDAVRGTGEQGSKRSR
jgi:hypothetical protein